jgi:hypothetical protein
MKQASNNNYLLFLLPILHVPNKEVKHLPEKHEVSIFLKNIKDKRSLNDVQTRNILTG